MAYHYHSHWQVDGQHLYLTRTHVNKGNYESTIEAHTHDGMLIRKELEKLATVWRKLGISERNIIPMIEGTLEKLPTAHLLHW